MHKFLLSSLIIITPTFGNIQRSDALKIQSEIIYASSGLHLSSIDFD